MPGKGPFKGTSGDYRQNVYLGIGGVTNWHRDMVAFAEEAESVHRREES